MIDLVIVDEVNAALQNISPAHLSYLIQKTELSVEGAFMTAAFKTKNWNGKESLITPDGLFFQHMIPEVLDLLETLGYNLDADVNLIDQREHLDDISVPYIDENFLYDKTKMTLRPYQVEGINAVIEHKKGFLDFATNAGKTPIILGISLAFESTLKSLVVVPSETLVHQTFKYYEKAGANAVAITKKIPPAKRQAAFEDHTHIIITTKLLLNCLDHVENTPFVFMYDESHKGGDVIFNAMRTALAECPVRVGLTGTMPKQKLKLAKVKAHIGGDVLAVVTVDELMSSEFASTTEIDVIRTAHDEVDEASEEKNWTWDKEDTYLCSNQQRVEAIASYIQSLETKNTLVLCHPQFGTRLAKYFNDKMITDDTPNDIRMEWFAEYESNDDVFLCGSFGCAATGISVDRIKRLILVDVGKNHIYIKQSIGRGLRLDGEENFLEVLDISSRTKYSNRHHKARMRIYKTEGFCYNQNSNDIIVESK